MHERVGREAVALDPVVGQRGFDAGDAAFNDRGVAVRVTHTRGAVCVERDGNGRVQFPEVDDPGSHAVAFAG